MNMSFQYNVMSLINFCIWGRSNCCHRVQYAQMSSAFSFSDFYSKNDDNEDSSVLIHSY